MSPTRLTTGVPGLDAVLDGGLLPGALAFIVGPPGAGKTVLAQQLAFHVAATGAKVLYFTTLSEPHSKLIGHARDFSFFDESLIGQSIHLLNLEQLLTRGAEETAEAVVQAARTERAAVVVIDAFRSAHEFFGGAAPVREFLYQLSAKLAVLQTTCVITFEGDASDRAMHPDLVTADVIIGVWHEPARLGQERQLQVLKARGSAPVPGAHSLVLSDAGATCYQQAETLPCRPAPEIAAGRAAFGVSSLDSMLNGGLTLGTSTVLAGNVGAGKSLLGLTWLVEGATAGEPGLYMGFHESAAQSLSKARQFGLDLDGAVDRGLIELWTQPPVALNPDQLAVELRRRLEARGVRRLVVDSERELEAATGSGRAHHYLGALVSYLRGEQVTTIFTREVSNFVGTAVDFADTPTSMLAENVLVLERFEFRGVLRYAMAVLKMRFSGFDSALHEYTIRDTGLVVGAPITDADGVLLGVALRQVRPRGGVA